MLGKVLIGGVIAVAALVASAGTGHASVSVDLGIHFGTPPIFEPVPASPVQYAPSIGANLFSYDGEFFVFLGSTWYVGPGHNGPWSELPPQYVPRPILAVPVNYYRVRPREWAHWRHDAPPRWAPTWGHRWEERYADRHHSYVDERRGVRHAAYRDDYRGARTLGYRDDHRGDRTLASRDDHRGRSVVFRDDHRDNRRSDRQVASRDDHRDNRRGNRDDRRDDRRGGDRRDGNRDDRR